MKRGDFRTADTGQRNFYLNVPDEQVKLPDENPAIWIVLCKKINSKVVEFSIKSIDKAMGVATYKTTSQSPAQLKGILPYADELAKLI